MLKFIGPAAMAAAMAMPVVAAAQSPPTPKAPVAPKVEQLDPNACAGRGAPATVGQGGDIEVKKPNDRTLSDRLARADGVICPPARVDPEIKAPTPPGGPMPVIPPPGSPGGNPAVRPK
ncbi:MAG: hypothetical protein GC182_13925 [Rhodopseudomonas sp.]|nr:hypothetical protein [Rhodopseudomonas sp.]